MSPMATMLVGAASLSLQQSHSQLVLQPHRQSALPKLLVLRGGVQSIADSPVALSEPGTPVSSTSLADVRKKSKIKLRRKSKKHRLAKFGLRDAAATVLCVSALGAAATSTDVVMAMFPKTLPLQSTAWMLIGGVVSAMLYMLVALVHYERAAQIGDAMCQLVFGGFGPRSSALARTLSPPAILFVLGSVASANTLPQVAG